MMLDAEAVLESADEWTKVIFLCSPNNPSGNSLDRGSIYKILKNYEYSGLKIDSVIPQTQDIEFTFTVKNTGNMAGKETALVFIRDCVSSVVTPVACLKGFEKVSLNPGESKDIRIVIPYSDLGLWNEDMKYVVESGKFNLMIGRSVEDIRIKKDFFIK